MKSTVFTVIAVLLICATAQFVAGDYTVRNYRDHNVYVCYAYWDTSFSGGHGAWRARGYYKVEPGQKRNLYVPSNQDTVYVRIESNGKEVQHRGNREDGFFDYHPDKAHSIYQKMVGGENVVFEGSSPVDGLERVRYKKYGNPGSFNFGSRSAYYRGAVTIKGLSIPSGKYKPDAGGNAFILLEQFGNTCGPTSLEMMLHYYGVKANMTDIWEAGDIHSVVTGTWPSEMRQALNGLGVPSHWYGGLDDPFGKLRYYVDQNRPPCILIRYEGSRYHWVVVVGYHPKRDEYLLADPAPPNFKWLSRDELATYWGFKDDRHGVLWEGGFRKEPWVDAAVAVTSEPYTVIVPLSAPTRNHFIGLWSEMKGQRITGDKKFLGTTRGFERTLKFDKPFDFCRVSAIEELGSRGTARLHGFKAVGERSVKIWGEIEDGAVLRGKMWVMVRTYRK